jgi:hypothetical protein
MKLDMDVPPEQKKLALFIFPSHKIGNSDRKLKTQLEASISILLTACFLPPHLSGDMRA